MSDIAPTDTFLNRKTAVAEIAPQAHAHGGACGLLVVCLCSAFLTALVAFFMGAGFWVILAVYCLGGAGGMTLAVLLQVLSEANRHGAEAGQKV